MRSQDEQPAGSGQGTDGVRVRDAAVLAAEPAAFGEAPALRDQPLVSVVIPAFNNAATLDETLRSASEQIWRSLEIIVVDDGSTDRTPEIVATHMLVDPRVRLIRQRNGGVAAARNRGVAESAGDFIALLDADDLWRPTKIARQMEVMLAADDQTAAVYNWCCLIDDEGRVISSGGQQPMEGNVFAEMCRRDIVGNGSALLVRRSAFLDVGGCDETLVCDGLHAGDDIKLHLALAERFDFGLVREELTGYRLRRGSGSESYDRLAEVHRQAVEPFRLAYPQYAPLMDLQRKELLQWFASRALNNRDPRGAVAMILRISRLDPLFALYSLIYVPLRPLLRLAKRIRSGAVTRYWSQTQGFPARPEPAGAESAPTG